MKMSPKCIRFDSEVYNKKGGGMVFCFRFPTSGYLVVLVFVAVNPPLLVWQAIVVKEHSEKLQVLVSDVL